MGIKSRLFLGNLEAKRDWGHAKDYVRGMWLMLQQEKADDYILATGKSHSVREFVEKAFSHVNRKISWTGSGTLEKGIDAHTGEILVEVLAEFYRPTEVNLLQGDSSKAEDAFKWQPTISFDQLVEEMVKKDIALLRHLNTYDNNKI